VHGHDWFAAVLCCSLGRLQRLMLLSPNASTVWHVCMFSLAIAIGVLRALSPTLHTVRLLH
jgi:hypothetical protein